MKLTETVVSDSIKEYGTDVVRERYKMLALSGFWESEEMLVKKYFGKRSKVLDLACGSGRTALALHKHGYQVTGVDLTPEMIEIAKDTAKMESASIRYEIGDITKLNFEDSYFDHTLLPNNGLASVPGHENRKQVLQEIHRVLKPGGYSILSIPLRWYGGPYFPHWLKSWMEYMVLPFLIGHTPQGVDFGDFFYHRHYNGQALEQVQFLHFFSKKEIEGLITQSRLDVVDQVFMSELSKEDTESGKGSLAGKGSTRKIQVYYVCQKNN